MKKLICELCQSQHMVKDGEFFVCESCGTKYTTEEAQKLYVEVSVKEDNTDKITNLYEVARRALTNGDNETALAHYTTLQSLVPDDWEALFFSTYCKSMGCVIANIFDACQAVSNVLEDTFTLIKKNVRDTASQTEAVRRVTAACEIIAETMANAAKSHDFKHMSNDAAIRRQQVTDRDNRIRAAVHVTTMCGTHCFTVLTDRDAKGAAVPAFKKTLELMSANLATSFTYKDEFIAAILDTIKLYDAKYVENYIERKIKSHKTTRTGSIVISIIGALCAVGGIAWALAANGGFNAWCLTAFGAFCTLIGIGFAVGASNNIKTEMNRKK